MEVNKGNKANLCGHTFRGGNILELRQLLDLMSLFSVWRSIKGKWMNTMLHFYRINYQALVSFHVNIITHLTTDM